MARHANRLARRSEGFVLVWAALMMTVLIGLAGMSVDVGNWYLNIQRVQRAADAAALAGDVFLPSNPTKARAVARQTLLENGVSQAQVNAALIEQTPGIPNQLNVRVGTVVNNTFLSLLGVKKEMTFTRKAVATHSEDINLGATGNVLGGFEPGSDPWQAAEMRSDAGYWLNISGGQTNKARGDRFSTAMCGTAADYCSGGRNNEYRTSGYEFRVKVDRGSTGRHLAIQAYDPAFVETGYAEDVGNQCPSAPNAYRNPCPGDHAYGQDGAGYGLTNTYYSVWTDEKEPKRVAGCPSRTFPGYSGNIDSRLNDPQFRSYFHNWADICTFPIDTVRSNSFIVRVQTDRNARGMNRFLLRAGMFNDGAAKKRDVASTQSKVKISATDVLPIYSNYAAGETATFSLAKIPMAAAGTTIRMELFDYGESIESYSPVTVQLVGSADMNSSPTGWGCKLDGPSYAPATSCGWRIPGNYYSDGRVMTVDVPVPKDYRCNEEVYSGCWLRVNTTYSSAADDASTWSINKKGNPLRLVR